jgi:hypothetical protein
MRRLWGTALLSVAVAAVAIRSVPPAGAQAETGLRLPVEIRAVGRVVRRAAPLVPANMPLSALTFAESEKRLTGALAGMTVTGSLNVRWDVDFQRREMRASIQGAELATPAGSLRLEFAQSGGENNFVVDVVGATGAFSGLTVRGMVTAKDLDPFKEQSFFSGFLVVAGDRQSLAARFGEAVAIASAPVALLPFPLAAMQMALQTAARLRVWEEPGGVLFEMYLLVGTAGDQGRKQKVRVTVAQRGAAERTILEGAYDPGTQLRLSGPIQVPAMVLVSQEGRVVVQLPISEQDVSRPN